MAAVITVAKYGRRAKRAIEADGLNDITLGLHLIAWGFVQYGGNLIRPTTAPYHTSFTKELLLFLGFIALSAVATFSKIYFTTLRERFVYPRLGYVAQPLAPQFRLIMTLCAVGLIGVLLTMVLSSTVSSDPDVPLPFWYNGLLVGFVGCLFSGGYLYHFGTLRFPRHLFLAALSLTTAFLLAQPQVKVVSDVGILTAVVGVASILAGAITYAGVLRLPPVTNADTGAEDAS